MGGVGWVVWGGWRGGGGEKWVERNGKRRVGDVGLVKKSGWCEVGGVGWVERRRELEKERICEEELDEGG